MGTHRSGRKTEIGAVTLEKQIFYGRRKARPIRQTRQAAMDHVLPEILIRRPARSEKSPGDDPTPAVRDGILNFPFEPKEIWFEIGFGNGASLAAWHRANPDIAFIGCEPFINGVSHLCKLLAEDDLSNIRIWNDVAQPLIIALPDASVDRIYLLNPDPWHKKRHAKRRFIQQDMLTNLARILKPGGMLVMTTDHANLAEWMFDEAMRHPDFTTIAKTLTDCATPPDGWLTTRYEGKGKTAGRSQVYLVFHKR